MKKIASIIVIVLLLGIAIPGITIPAWAEENTSKGDFNVLIGNKSLVQGDYKITDKLTLNGEAGEVSDYVSEKKYNDERDYYLRTDLRYQANSWFGIKLGARYDSQPEETIPYAGIDFETPFGTSNLRLTGFYNYNYEGKDWSNYEIAWRIEMYKHQYIFAGIGGNDGDGFKPYSYNTENDPEFFLRGDFTGAWSKFSLNFRPLLYASGEIFTDTKFRFALNNRTNLILNFNDYYDHDMKYRLGIEHKF